MPPPGHIEVLHDLSLPEITHLRHIKDVKYVHIIYNGTHFLIEVHFNKSTLNVFRCYEAFGAFYLPPFFFFFLTNAIIKVVLLEALYHINFKLAVFQMFCIYRQIHKKNAIYPFYLYARSCCCVMKFFTLSLCFYYLQLFCTLNS